MNDMNSTIAELCEWTDIRIGYYEGDGGIDVFGIPPGADDERPLPRYTADLNAALAAMDCVESPFVIYVDIQFKGGYSIIGIDGNYSKGLSKYSSRVSLHDADKVLWLKTVDTVEEIPAAICEAILQAQEE
jgi:hypothetical protein